MLMNHAYSSESIKRASRSGPLLLIVLQVLALRGTVTVVLEIGKSGPGRLF